MIARILFYFAIALPVAAQFPLQLPPGVGNGYDQIKDFLGLNAEQLTKLQTILQNRAQESQKASLELNAKLQEKNRLLNSEQKDALAIGRLEIELNAIQRSTFQPANPARYREQALEVLTAPQRAKLAELEHAMQLQPMSQQAAALNLIDFSRPLMMRPLQAPGPVKN